MSELPPNPHCRWDSDIPGDNRQAFYDAETHRVVEILKQANPERIIRFGSSVWGRLDQDSDIDLCVLTQYEDSAIREKQRLRRLLSRHQYAYPVDVELHVFSPHEYEARLKRGDLFLREIARGEVVYVRG